MTAPKKNWLEWVIFAVGAVLVLGTVGFLARAVLTAEDTPPRLLVALGEPVSSLGRFEVPVTVTNRGTQSAEQVEIEVTLKLGGAEELARLQLAFVPRLSAREGWVTFVGDPAQGELAARPLGYEAP